MKKTADPLKVLVLMPDDIIRTFARRTLRTRGHRVTVTDDFDNAVHFVSNHPFDAVTVEYQLIARHGMAELDRLRDAAGGRTRFVIQAAMPAKAPAGLIRKGRDQLLVKPFSLRDLVKAIESRGGRRRYQPNIQYRGLHA